MFQGNAFQAETGFQIGNVAAAVAPPATANFYIDDSEPGKRRKSRRHEREEVLEDVRRALYPDKTPLTLRPAKARAGRVAAALAGTPDDEVAAAILDLQSTGADKEILKALRNEIERRLDDEEIEILLMSLD